MDQVTVSRELLRQVIEKAEATTRHFNIERLGESTYKDTNTRCELHEAVNKLRVALEQPAVETADFDQIATERYKVVEAHESLFHRWAVVAGNGKQQLYVGREVECQNMARKFAGAFLDGAWLASQHTAPQAQEKS